MSLPLAEEWVVVDQKLHVLELADEDKEKLWPLLVKKSTSEALGLVTGRHAVPSLKKLLSEGR